MITRTRHNFSPVDHVAYGVYISGMRAIYEAETLRNMGLTHVLKLYEDAPFWPDDFTVCDNPLPDGVFLNVEQLERGVAFVKEHIASEKTVLIQCGAGISRSATFVLAYLVDRGYDLPDAWELLKSQHEQANPHPELWRSLISHYDLPYSLDDIANWME